MNRIEKPWFSFNGVRNTDVGVLMVSQPVRQHPVMRVDKKTVNGRQGDLMYSQDSYGNITVKVDCVVPNDKDIPNAIKWLSGSGELVFFDSPLYAYDAYIITNFQRSAVAKRLSGQKFSVTFTCLPFRHALKQPNITITTSEAKFNGVGDCDADPVVIVEGVSSVSNPAILTINGDEMHLVLRSGTPLYIDCEAGTAFTKNADGSNAFAGKDVVISPTSDWFKLKAKPLFGSSVNTVSISNNITKVTIIPYWRYF